MPEMIGRDATGARAPRARGGGAARHDNNTGQAQQAAAEQQTTIRRVSAVQSAGQSAVHHEDRVVPPGRGPPAVSPTNVHEEDNDTARSTAEAVEDVQDDAAAAAAAPPSSPTAAMVAEAAAAGSNASANRPRGNSLPTQDFNVDDDDNGSSGNDHSVGEDNGNGPSRAVRPASAASGSSSAMATGQRRHSIHSVANRSTTRATAGGAAAGAEEEANANNADAGEPRHSSLDHNFTVAQPPQQPPIADPYNIDAYGNPLVRRRTSLKGGSAKPRSSLPDRRNSNDDEYDPIRRQSMGGSYGLAAAAFATSARNLVGDSRRQRGGSLGLGTGSAGGSNAGGVYPDRRVGRATSMDTATKQKQGGGGGGAVTDAVPEFVGARTSSGGGGSSTKSLHSAHSGVSSVTSGGGANRTKKHHAGRRSSSSKSLGGKMTSALIRQTRKAKSSRAVLGSYLTGRKSYGDGLSDSDEDDHDGGQDSKHASGAGEASSSSSAGAGVAPTSPGALSSRFSKRDSILETGEEDESSTTSDAAAASGEDDVSDLDVPDDDGDSAGSVSLWERGQRASGKNLPKRPSQTRLDPLGDMGVPYVPRRDSNGDSKAGGANAEWEIGGAQPPSSKQPLVSVVGQEFSLPLEVPTKHASERRPSSFRRWSTDTEGSFLPNDPGAALQTGKMSRHSSMSFGVKAGDQDIPQDAKASIAKDSDGSDLNISPIDDSQASVESGSTGASTVQRVGGTADPTAKKNERATELPPGKRMGRRASYGGTLAAAKLAIPESEAVVPPPSSNTMPTPKSPLRRGTALDDDSTPTSPKAGGSAYLPDVGIVSVSAASAKGIMQGQNLAVLDLTTGRHFVDRRSRSIAFGAPNYSQRLSGRLSMGQKSRSIRHLRGGSISMASISESSTSSSKAMRSVSIGGSHSHSTFGSSRKSSIDTRKSSMSHSRRSIGSVLSVFDREKAETSSNIMGDRDVDAATGLTGTYIGVDGHRRSSGDSLDGGSLPSLDEDGEETVYSDPSNTFNRSMATLNTRTMTDAPLPVLEELDLGEQDISLDDDVRGPYQRRNSISSRDRGYSSGRPRSTAGTSSDSSIMTVSLVYAGLDPSEVEEERLNPRSLRYLPQILRESYACPSAAVRQRASMVSSDSVEKAGAAAAAAIELRMRLRRPRALPECRDVKGSVLILDVSGFTALGERLKKKLGDSEGAAEFAHRVDTILSTMVEHVYDCGGDVLMFAGDALICLFDERPLDPPITESDGQLRRTAADTNAARREETIARVRSCCNKVFTSSNLEGKDFTIHGGSSHGVVRCYFLGRPSTRPGDCTFVVSGTPLRAAGHLLNKADRGEILIDGLDEPITKELAIVEVSKPLAALMEPEEELPNLPNFVRRKSWKLTAEFLSEFDDDSETADELILNHDVHPFAKAYLGSLAARRSDHAQDGMSILLNELRPVAIVFAGLHDLTNVDARDAVLLRKMNGVFVSMSRITHSCDGAVKEMSFDDKGCVFISVFGAHSHGANPCFDATMCAMRMQDALKKLEFRNFSLGVSFGDCFCGEVGPEMRADYVVMGTEVNTAARLMGKAPNQGILVSKRIFTNSKKYISFIKSEKIKVKGIDEPFHAYVPQDRIVQTNVVDDTKKSSQPFILMPSRQFDMKTMLTAVGGVLRGRPKTILVCGGPFLGKSRMIQELNNRATDKGFTILQSFRTSLDCFTSYFPFRQITMSALKKCAATVSSSKEEFDNEAKAVDELLGHKILSKTDRMMLGSIIPSISDAQLISLLPKNPKTMTKAIVESFIKVLKPLQPVMLVFEGDGEIDPSSWSLISELMLRAVKQCPKLMFVISSRSAPAVPSAMTTSLSDDIIHVKLTPFEKYETEIYLKVLLGVREKGIGIDEKMLYAVHHRANGCPQFIEYIVRWALDKDLIEYVESHNSMSFKALDAHSDDDIIPRELSSIVLAAFNDLSPILWDALKIASCIGYSFDADVYNALTGDLDFIPKIKRLASSYDAFEMCDGNRYKWKHQAVYEAVKSLLINSQRQKIHSMIVEVFERSVDMDLGEVGKGDVHRLLARHCSLAQKWGSAFNQYMEAGKRAEEIYNFTEATRMYEEALSMQGKMTPKPLLRSRLLPTMKLGNCLRELARYEESEKVLTQCLAETERAMAELDGDEQMYVHVLTSLATLYQNKSKYKDAKELYEKALPIARNVQESRSSLWLAGQIAGYAEILRKSGDLPSAEALHREALDIRNLAAEEGSGTELELAISFTQLGCTLFGLKRFSEAYSKHRMALFSRFKYLDFSHGLVSESLNYCAESLCSLDRGCEGIPLAMHAVKIRKIVFGTSHPAYAHALSVLASCYYASGRSCDARDFFHECIDICESAFPKNHANMIPNLMNYGKVLRSTGDLRKARDVFERAITIHQINFKEGQRAAELEKCTQEVSEINVEIATETDQCKATEKKSPAELAIANSPQCMDIFSKGSPIIVVTDVGRDVDDEYCLVLLSALKRMHLLNPIAIISTLAPQEKRAHLARGVLDSLGMPGVPVGVGSSGGVAEGVELEVYSADYARPCSCVVKDGVQLMVEGLRASPDKSVQLLIIAALTDVATVMQDYEELFLQKVKELVVMGGLKPLDDASEFVEPDTAYNNNCDMKAASYVYRRCQELRIPTLTISRYAAYGCPIAVSVLDSLCETEHMVAHNIKGVSVNSINSLWKKVNYPEDDPRREKLPARCDRTWFCRTFFGTDDTDKNAEESIWGLLENLNMYDPLALMACVPAYREANFLWDTKYVNGTPHRIAGVSQAQNGIVDASSMSDEMAALFTLGFRNSMQGISQQ